MLAQALAALGPPLLGVPLESLPDKGLAHDHVRLCGTGWLARIPKQSQMGWDAADNLSYQQACFERALPGGHTPALRGVLPPSDFLPRGALLVDEVQGRSAWLPDDLPALANALSAMHRLPVPEPAGRAPLRADEDPLRALYEEILAQASWWPQADVDASVTQFLQDELRRLDACCQAEERPDVSLVVFDAHPGNFLVQADGRAMLVDLEKCRYSYPGLDLAHATLYTSTTWDRDSHCALEPQEVASFYRVWSDGAQASPDTWRWHLPLRRAMWLWSLTWCAKWRVLSSKEPASSANGEDWSADRSDADLVQHVRERVNHYLDPAVVRRLRVEMDQLTDALQP